MIRRHYDSLSISLQQLFGYLNCAGISSLYFLVLFKAEKFHTEEKQIIFCIKTITWAKLLGHIDKIIFPIRHTGRVSKISGNLTEH